MLVPHLVLLMLEFRLAESITDLALIIAAPDNHVVRGSVSTLQSKGTRGLSGVFTR